jgi:hypothetical protein
MQSSRDAVLRRAEPKEHCSNGAGRGLALATLCLAVLIAQLDSSVVNLAVQPIGRSLDASVAELQWTIDGYNLAYAVLLLTGGLLADLDEQVRLAHDDERRGRIDWWWPVRSGRRRGRSRHPSRHHRPLHHRARHGRGDRPLVRGRRRRRCVGALRHRRGADQRRAHGRRHDWRGDYRQRVCTARRRPRGPALGPVARRRRATCWRRYGLDRRSHRLLDARSQPEGRTTCAQQAELVRLKLATYPRAASYEERHPWRGV